VSCSQTGDGVGTVCNFVCDANYELVGAVQSTCLSTGFYSDPAPVCQLLTCAPLRSFANGFATCSTTNNAIGTECIFTCDPGYQLLGQTSSRCNGYQYDNDVPVCQAMMVTTCPGFNNPVNGVVQCSAANNAVDTVCTFSCNEGYQLVGSAQSTCLASGLYSDIAPTCQLITCAALTAPQFGTISCSSNNNGYGTYCDFQCNPGYQLVGASESVCLGTGLYSDLTPDCVAILVAGECPAIQSPEFGNLPSCTNGNKQGSVCSFSCPTPDYELFPANDTSATCGADLQWDIPSPCCVRGGCDLNKFKVDVIVVLDSSSSVKIDNWNKMINLVITTLDEFTIGPNAALVSAFRYNIQVDAASQVLLKDFSDRQSLYAGIRKIPYDGSGTDTGAALNHVKNVMLDPKNGNRPDAPDLVIMVTDGLSKNDIRRVSATLRQQNTMVFALGLGSRANRPRVQAQLSSMAGGSGNVLASSSWDTLNSEFAGRIRGTLCANKCRLQREAATILN